MMVRAAVTGAIDFSKSDPYDRRWTLRLRLVIDEMIRQSSLQFVGILHQHYMACMAIPNLQPDSFKQMRNSENELLEVIISRLEPWNKDQVSKTQRDTAHAAVAEWEAHYGKLDDPKVQAAIDATVIAVQKYRVEQEMRRKAQEAIWKGNRKGTRKERHRAKRMGKHRRA